MKNLRLIKTKERISYKPDINTYKRAMKRFCEEQNLLECPMSISEWYEEDKDSFSKMFYLEIKLLRYGKRDARGEIRTLDEAKAWMDMMFSLEEMFSMFTPRELLQMFPVTKTYDGSKWQTKDYFYTMDKISTLNPDKSIKEQIGGFELMCDYQNIDIDLFAVDIMEAIDILRRMQGQQGMLEEFMAEHGVTPMTINEKERYIYNPATGKSFPITKPKMRKPKWMKVVDGRNE